MGQIRDALDRLLATQIPTRTHGRPPAGNGASSFHIWWDTDQQFVSVAATLEIIQAPTADRLYFFALQASFWSATHEGGAHTGLQWNQRHAGSTAVNWGGYDDRGRVLAGTESSLFSTPNDPNTRDYPWEAATRYRFQIGPVGEHGWPASVTNLETGETTPIRHVPCDGDHLRAPVVWSEVFADCDASPVSVRWSNLSGMAADGREVATTSGRVSYQNYDAGGCTNTTVTVDDAGVVQRSGSNRVTDHNTTVSWR